LQGLCGVDLKNEAMKRHLRSLREGEVRFVSLVLEAWFAGRIGGLASATDATQKAGRPW